MYKVYILKSENYKRFYVGYTEDLEVRLSSHNKGNVKSTKAYRPWKIVYSEESRDKKSAFLRERQIKSYKGGNAFKKLLSP